jgi:predicted small metal-binding protein
MSRKMMDCREFPSDSKCTLTIAGEEEEVLRAATLHAVDVHGHKDTPEFRNELRRAMKDERAGR